ncbi:MAG: polyprenyl synthetase [Comamonadaceae bacterium CG1_02_60_18]|nr:MAG: polyprenyl synthetase [Comamonadaceae bacterium CG1_02_60_18]PIQ51695.1 MAG: polyprenyl synthetase [Comamonadaceae bacterium CG12_big_fil_rev_8_21_14_0_65_59_15]
MSAAFDFQPWMAAQLAAVEHALDTWVSIATTADMGHQAPADLMAAMRYAVQGGGKRLRPLLVLATAQATGAPPGHEAALRAACATELIHAYSLVHDDMPCMDNDVLRRGKPTVHVQFGEAVAMLAGDALQALAFELLTPDVGVISAAQQAQLCRLLSRAAGCAGMAGGQAIDLASVGLHLTEAQLREMHRLKTGALLQASVMMGAACGSASAQAQAALQTYGAAIGLAFQVVDDMLDVTADSATLGKTAGKDAAADKPTYVSLMGLTAAGAYAQSLHDQAVQALADSGLGDTQALQALANWVVNRSC